MVDQHDRPEQALLVAWVRLARGIFRACGLELEVSCKRKMELEVCESLRKECERTDDGGQASTMGATQFLGATQFSLNGNVTSLKRV